MKRPFIAAAFAAVAIAAAALTTPAVGSIDYVEGGVSIGRAGKTIAAPNIGDAILSGDLVKTQSDGMVIIKMGSNSGMSGQLTVKPRSSIYVKLDALKGEPRTQIEVLTGAIGSKISKIAGAPTMQVTTSSAVMAVRGTEFTIAISINANDGGDSQQATLVTCTESKVAVNDGQGEVEVPAGKVLEKRPGEKMRFLPVAESSVAGFSERWMTEEIAAFKVDAPRALTAFAKRYVKLSADFAAAYDSFQKSPIPKKWADEDRLGAKVNPLDPAAMKEMKEIAGYLLKIKKVLFMFERVYYRADELADAIAGTDAESAPVLPGKKKGEFVKAGEFVKSVRAEQDKFAAQVARYRYIEDLYAARSPAGADGAFSSDESFFVSPDGF